MLFITAGGQQVDRRKAEAIAGETLSKADATLVRTTTGFAIGGVAPVAHKTPYPIYFDETLLKYDLIWVEAGTPNHVFSIPPDLLTQKILVQVSDFII